MKTVAVVGASNDRSKFGNKALRAFHMYLPNNPTLHKFQGWADKFLTTPPEDIKDLYASAGYTFTKVGPFASIAATAASALPSAIGPLSRKYSGSGMSDENWRGSRRRHRSQSPSGVTPDSSAAKFMIPPEVPSPWVKTSPRSESARSTPAW